MKETKFIFDKESISPKTTSWKDKGTLNFLAFPDVKAFQGFLSLFGIAEPITNGGIRIKASTISSTVEAVGQIILTAAYLKYSIAHDFGLSKGNSCVLKTKQDSIYLTIFNNFSWELYLQQEIVAGRNYLVEFDVDGNCSLYHTS